MREKIKTKFRICYTAQDGSKYHIYDSDRHLLTLQGEVLENYGTEKKPMWEHVFDGESPAFIQQYTGLKDKNGKEIYEGDIISCYEYIGNGMKDHHRPNNLIMFDGCCWCYSVNFKNPHQILRYAKEIEVIGNIFENPELID